MRKIVILLFGTLLFLLLAWLCLGRHAPVIEKDLAVRTNNSLTEAGMGWLQIGIDGRDVILAGTVPTAALRDEAGEVVLGVHGVRTVDNRIAVEGGARAAAGVSSAAEASAPYGIRFLKNESGVMIIDGKLPDEESRTAIAEAARQQVGSGQIQERLSVAPGAPPGWLSAAERIAERSGQFIRMSATLTDTGLQLEGVVDSDSVRADVEQAISSALPPGGFASRLDITVSPSAVAAANCQQQFVKLLARRKIHFEPASAQITADSFSLLDELASIASKCPEADIDIEGHTDAQGSEQMNMALSQARARSVVGYLTAKGIAAGRLSAIGYGESRPVASNETEAGRAANRRIEFKVTIHGS